MNRWPPIKLPFTSRSQDGGHRSLCGRQDDHLNGERNDRSKERHAAASRYCTIVKLTFRADERRVLSPSLRRPGNETPQTQLWGWRAALRYTAMELKYVGRQLLRRPGHTLAVIACLVVGLVATVGTFSVISSVFYGDRPGIAGRRSLAQVFLRYDGPTPTEGGRRRIVTAPPSFNDFAIMRELPVGSSLEAVGAEGPLQMTAAGSHGPVSIIGAFVSGDSFRALPTVPLHGRLLTPEDDRPAAAAVAVVTEYFWRTHLDARDDAVGRQTR